MNYMTPRGIEALEEIEAEQGVHVAFARAMRELDQRAARARHRGKDGLLHFIADFWPQLEPGRTLATGWALRAMCDHLTAVSEGKITRLLINVPPGSMKSLLVNVFWPAWEWGPFKRPDMRYVSFSYGAHLTQRDNQKFMDLVKSAQYQELYGSLVTLRDEAKIKTSNKRTGWKFATSVGGIGTGERGDRVLLDDPHNVKESESDTVRTDTVRWFREAMSNRLNDMDASVIIIIMQRVHQDDVSGAALEDGNYVHLMIPLEFEIARRCVTKVAGRVFWADPRQEEGECFWPDRFSSKAVVLCKLQGEYAYAGQYQQRPEARGGGLFKRDYWRRLPLRQPGNKFPTFKYIVASLDGAFTEKTVNDPCGFTVWGAFTDDDGNAAAVTLCAWAKHLKLHGKVRPKIKAETWDDYKAETSHEWGLIQWLDYECRRWGGVDKLLIENKANGHDVNNELIRLFAWAKAVVELVDPGQNDKWARGMRVQGVFSEGLIYTLEEKLQRRWVAELIDELAIFPRGKHDDRVDSSTQAIWWMRKAGLLIMGEERMNSLVAKEKYKRRLQPLYQL